MAQETAQFAAMAIRDYCEFGWVVVKPDLKDLVVDHINKEFKEEVDIREYPSGEYVSISRRVNLSENAVIACIDCGKKPEEIKYIVNNAKADKVTPDEWIKENEGTFNRENNKFYCDPCYIAAGTPLGKAGAEQPASPKPRNIQRLLDDVKKKL